MKFKAIGFIGPAGSGKSTGIMSILDDTFLNPYFYLVKIYTNRKRRQEERLDRIAGLSRSKFLKLYNQGKLICPFCNEDPCGIKYGFKPENDLDFTNHWYGHSTDFLERAGNKILLMAPEFRDEKTLNKLGVQIMYLGLFDFSITQNKLKENLCNRSDYIKERKQIYDNYVYKTLHDFKGHNIKTIDISRYSNIKITQKIKKIAQDLVKAQFNNKIMSPNAAPQSHRPQLKSI